MKRYAGIGSRETPPDVIRIMNKIAKALDNHGFHLLTGDASGADQAFRNYSKNKTIYTARDATQESMDFARKFIPHWDKLNDFAKKLHGRNPYQILGNNLNQPVNFCICYTEKGKLIGGTRTAIVIANHYKIPCFNLGEKEGLKNLLAFLKEKYLIDLFTSDMVD